MKKLILGAVALAIAVVGFGSLNSPSAQAAPVAMWTINDNILNAIGSCTTCDLTDAAQRALIAGELDDLQAASAGQLSETPAITGTLWVLVSTDGSLTNLTLNGKGMVCNPDCSAAPAAVAPGADDFAVWEITDQGSVNRGETRLVEVTQDGTTIGTNVTVVGAPHDLQIAVVGDKTTIQEAAPSCAITDSIEAPQRAGVLGGVLDIDGTLVAGVPLGWSTQDASVVDIALTAGITMQVDGGVVVSFNVACGDNVGQAEVRVTAAGGVLVGQASPVTRAALITVTGVPANIDLVASPASIPCDGVSSSTVTATVTDAAGNDVVDNTPVNFSVVALGTANPINTTTAGGQASSQITPLSGATAGVTVIATSGQAQSSILVNCEEELLTPEPTEPTPVPTGVTPPGTGTGFVSQDSAGFPLWTLLALAAASIALVGGGLVTRRAGN